MRNCDQRSLKGVALIGLAMMLLFGIIAIISDPFEYDQAWRETNFSGCCPLGRRNGTLDLGHPHRLTRCRWTEATVLG